MIIPPSTLAVPLGSIARIDDWRAVDRGLLPGLLLATLYVIAIYLQARPDPESAPRYDVDSVPLLAKLRRVSTNILPWAWRRQRK